MEILLVVAGNQSIPDELAAELGHEYTILPGADYVQAIDQFRKFTPKVVALDLGLPGDLEWDSEGFRCLQWILASQPDTKVVVLTGNGDRETAHRALRCGAYDFHQKPVNLAELKLVIRRAFELSSLEEERRRLKETLERRGAGLEGIVGQCGAMQRIFSAVQMVSASDVPVLITGETGTGKELVARTIKSLSARADGPFVPVRCTAISKELLDGELFGSEHGACSGGVVPVPGKIEHARKGTLFLDEPAELPHQVQLRLLRFLQEGRVQRVGGGGDVEVDTRVICATSAEPARVLRAGELLEELYYRISVITLELPPLRARGGDIMLLAHLFLRRFAQACNGKARGFSSAAVSALESHSWPGNVRELEGRVQRGVIMSDGPFLEPKSLGFSGAEAPREDPAPARGMTLKEARDRVERKVISAAVASSRGNLAKASELLDVSRSTLYDLLKKHGLFNAGVRG
jgi:two-component system, NtrC family, response regulator